jgi:glycosyltransferase involved in cell wall biosynthesis
MSRRIGFLIDFRLFRCGDELRTDSPMVQFALGFRAYFDRIVLIARVFPDAPDFDVPYVVRDESVDVVPLPPYPQISSLYSAPHRYWPQIRRSLAATLPGLDALWLNFGHPVSLLALHMAARRPSIRLFSAVRGSYDRDAELRSGGPRIVKQLAGGVMRGQMNLFARRAARMRIPCFAFGSELEERLRGLGVFTIGMADSLIRDEDLSRDISPDPALATDLLAVGRLAPEKGLDVLLRALPAIRRDDGAPASLRIVGSGPLAADLQRQARDLGVAERVRFDGHVSFGSELFARYRSARLLVIPSHTEGLPKTAYEAMAFGCPVLATRVGGLPEIVGTNGERGRLVAPGDPDALARVASSLLGDPAELESMAERAMRYGRQFSLETQVRKMMDYISPSGSE